MYYDILKASKVKAEVFPDYWTLLWGRKMSASMIKTITGVLPLTFTAKAGNAVDWVVEGNDDVGKNLLEITATSSTTSGVSYVANKNDGTIIANGTAQGGNSTFQWNYELAAGSYVLSGCLSQGSTSTFGLNVSLLDWSQTWWDYGSGAVINLSETTTVRVRIVIYNGVSVNNLVFKPMLRKSDTSPDFEPYQQGVGERTVQLFDFQQFAGGTQTTTNSGLTFTRDNDTVIVNNTSIANYPLVFLNDKSGLTVPQLTQGQTYSGKVFISNAPSGCNIYVDVVGKNQGGDWTWINDIPASGNSFTLSTPYDIYGYRLVCQGTGISYENTRVKFVLTKGSTAPTTYIPYGYEVPLTISQTGQPDKTVDIYIGDSPLTSGDYVDYESGKIYKAKRIHEDTVTTDGIVWDILDYDHDEVYKADGTRAKHTVTIQSHDIINNLQYSARQAAFAFPNGLAAGTYHFTVGEQPNFAGDVGKALTFTLANAIPSGGQLVFNGAHNKTLVGTTITAFASPTSTTAVETVTMTEGSTGTDLGTILRSKTDTVNSIDRAFLGSNNWIESAMRQYLNSDKTAGNAWTPQTVFDRPPSWAGTASGFLNGKSTNFVSHIGTAKKTTGLNSITDGGGAAVSDEKVFLLSSSEVYLGDEFAGGEGTPYAYYKNYSDNPSPSTVADSNRIKYRAGTASDWWLRSISASFANYIRLIKTSGAVNTYSAVNAIGVAPACCIVLDDMDDWVKQTFYTEVDADLPAIELFNGENTVSTTLYNKPDMEIKYK